MCVPAPPSFQLRLRAETSWSAAWAAGSHRENMAARASQDAHLGAAANTWQPPLMVAEQLCSERVPSLAYNPSLQTTEHENAFKRKMLCSHLHNILILYILFQALPLLHRYFTRSYSTTIYISVFCIFFLFNIHILPDAMRFYTQILNECDVSSNECVGLYLFLYL